MVVMLGTSPVAAWFPAAAWPLQWPGDRSRRHRRRHRRAGAAGLPRPPGVWGA